jgi:hypothetical protein
LPRDRHSPQPSRRRTIEKRGENHHPVRDRFAIASRPLLDEEGKSTREAPGVIPALMKKGGAKRQGGFLLE